MDPEKELLATSGWISEQRRVMPRVEWRSLKLLTLTRGICTHTLINNHTVIQYLWGAG